MYNSKIIAFEHFAPDNFISNNDLSEFLDTSDEWINSRTGIKKRCILQEGNTSTIATNVALNLIEKAGISPLEIDLILIATVTPDYLMPSTACIVQGNINATNAIAFDISAACSGFVYALSTADKFIKSGVYKNAIVIGADVVSKTLDWQDRSTCVLFGDGAGGVLLTASQNENSIISEDLMSDGKGWQYLTSTKVGSPSPFYKNKEKNDSDYFLKMDGRRVFNFATKVVPESILKVLNSAKVSMESIKYIVPHQANYRIVEVLAQKLNVSIDKFFLNLQDFGNTSSASIPIALSEITKKGLVNKGEKIIITGFGGGLTWGSILISI